MKLINWQFLIEAGPVNTRMVPCEGLAVAYSKTELGRKMKTPRRRSRTYDSFRRPVQSDRLTPWKAWFVTALAIASLAAVSIMETTKAARADDVASEEWFAVSGSLTNDAEIWIGGAGNDMIDNLNNDLAAGDDFVIAGNKEGEPSGYLTLTHEAHAPARGADFPRVGNSQVGAGVDENGRNFLGSRHSAAVDEEKRG